MGQYSAQGICRVDKIVRSEFSQIAPWSIWKNGSLVQFQCETESEMMAFINEENVPHQELIPHKESMILDFTAFGTVRNTCTLCISHPIYNSLLQHLE